MFINDDRLSIINNVVHVLCLVCDTNMHRRINGIASIKISRMQFKNGFKSKLHKINNFVEFYFFGIS